MADRGRRGIDLFTGFLMVACLAMAVLVVLLARQNRELKTQIGEMLSASAPAPSVEPGDPLGEMVLRDAAGAELPLEFDGGEQRTVLLVFSTQCPACRETMPIWSEVLAQTSEPAARVLAVQLDEPDEGSGAVLSVPIYHLDREQSPAMAGIPYIPATIVLDGSGTVERVWFGVPEEEARRTLAAALRAEV